MKIERGVLWMLLVCCFCLPGIAHATGLHAVGTSTEVRIESMRYDLTLRERHVSAVMEVRFWADSGEDHAANLRFPLPDGAVLHRAEIYLPDQDRWETAETMGRKEGQDAFDNPVVPDTQRLLVQRIGRDFYRARVFPVENAARLVLRLHYAHTLEDADGEQVLRVAHASPDVVHSTPNNPVRIHVHAAPGVWTGAAFSEPGGAFSPSDGEGELVLGDDLLDRDIEVRLTPAVSMSPVSVLRYVPTSRDLEAHTHAAWMPDLSGHANVAASARNVVIVLDRSGSMAGQKLIEAKNAVQIVLGDLEAGDQFGLLSFSSGVDTFKSSMSGIGNVEDAVGWVSEVQSNGSTAMASALSAAVVIGATSNPEQPIDILLITDGNPTDGPTTAQGMLDFLQTGAGAGREIRIFGVGIGFDLSQGLINDMSTMSGGESTFALEDAAITGQVLDLFSRMRTGGIGDAHVFVTSTSDADGLFLPRVFPGDRLSLGTTVEEPTLLVLDGVANDGQHVSVTSPMPDGLTHGAPFGHIAAPLAAKAWADEIELTVDRNEELPETVDDAVVLAKTYGIVTRYASLVAMSTDEAYEAQGIDRVRRDAAGIALDPVLPSTEDESRIGGQGLGDAPSAPGGGAAEGEGEGEGSGHADGLAHDGPANGCACAAAGVDAPRAHGWLWLLLAAGLLRRRRGVC